MKLFRLMQIFMVLLALLSWGCTPYMKANSALNKGNYPEAISYFQEYIAANPDAQKAVEKLGYAYLQAGQYDKAAEQLEKALQASPESSLVALYLGQAYLKTEQLEKAIATWRPFSDDSESPAGKEIKRLLTLLEIMNAKRMAADAVQNESALAAASMKPNSFAVFYFEDLSPNKDLRPVQKALASMVISDLSQIDSINVVERVRLQALLDEMALGQTGLVDMASAPKAGRLLGAEKLVVGSLNPTGELRVNTSTASTEQGKVLNSFALADTMERFFVIQKEIVYNIIQANDIQLSAAEKAVIDQYHTKNFEAFSMYGKGLDALDSGDWAAAKDFFDRAYELDPTFMLAKGESEGAPSSATPSVTSVSVSAISAAVSDVAERAVTTATAETAAAESESESDSTGGGGEGGDGGGGH